MSPSWVCHSRGCLCSSGVGRTGAFCLLYAAMQEVEAGNGIPDLAQIIKRMRQQRKHMLQEKVVGPWGGGRGVGAVGQGLTLPSSSSLAAAPQVLL